MFRYKNNNRFLAYLPCDIKSAFQSEQGIQNKTHSIKTIMMKIALAFLLIILVAHISPRSLSNTHDAFSTSSNTNDSHTDQILSKSNCSSNSTNNREGHALQLYDYYAGPIKGNCARHRFDGPIVLNRTRKRLDSYNKDYVYRPLYRYRASHLSHQKLFVPNLYG